MCHAPNTSRMITLLTNNNCATEAERGLIVSSYRALCPTPSTLNVQGEVVSWGHSNSTALVAQQQLQLFTVRVKQAVAVVLFLERFDLTPRNKFLSDMVGRHRLPMCSPESPG